MRQIFAPICIAVAIGAIAPDPWVQKKGIRAASRAAVADDVTARSVGEWQSERTNTGKLIDASMYMTADQKEDVRTKSAEHNVFEAVQKAANAAGAAGATLYFPPGAYRTDSIIRLKSNTKVLCSSGKETSFRPVYSVTIFSNENYDRDPGIDMRPTDSDHQTDENISVEGCVFDFRRVGVDRSPTAQYGVPTDHSNAARFYLAKNVKFIGNEILGNEPPVAIMMGGTTRWVGSTGAVACIGVESCEIVGNIFFGTLFAVDVWKGTKHAMIRDNIIRLASNDVAHRPNAYCIGINGRGSAPDDDETTSDVVVANNHCEIAGYAGGIQFDALGPASFVRNITIRGNTVVARSGTTINQGIYGRGRISGVSVSYNTIVGVDSYPLLGGGMFSPGGPFTCENCITLNKGSASAVVSMKSYHKSKIAVGNYLTITATEPVGVAKFSGGYHRVISVDPGVSATVQLSAPAPISASGGGFVSTQVFWGTISNSKFFNNRFRNINYPGKAVISVTGVNNVVKANSGMEDDAARGRSYGAFVYTSSVVANRPEEPRPVVGKNSAPQGTGIAGSGGDGLNAYDFRTTPMISNAGVDTD